MNSAQLSFLLMYSLATVMQVFNPNYAGTNVAENCSSLSIGAYSSDWFEFELIEKRSFLILITRFMRPLAIRAGIFFQINAATFIKVLFNIEHKFSL